MQPCWMAALDGSPGQRKTKPCCNTKSTVIIFESHQDSRTPEGMSSVHFHQREHCSVHNITRFYEELPKGHYIPAWKSDFLFRSVLQSICWT